MKKSPLKAIFILLGIIIFCAVIIYFAGNAFFNKEEAALDQTNEAFIVSGDVQIKKAKAGAQWQKMASSTVLEKGDTIKTAMGSTADISIGKNTEKAVKIKENSSVTFDGINPTSLNLPQGKVLVMLKKLEPKSSFVVKTPTAICGARGTAWLQEATPDKTRICVFDSEVFTRKLSLSGSPEWGKHIVIKGDQVLISQNGSTVTAKISESDMQDWRYWQKTIEFLRSGRLLVNDFNRRENFNNLGLAFGSWNVFYSDLNQYCRDEFTAREMVGDKGFGLKLTYDVDTPFSAYNGFFTRLGGVNVSDYKYLVFYIKGDKVAGFTTKVSIELKNDRQTGRQVVKNITDQWQKVAIPLTAFGGMNSFEDMKEFVIVFSDNNVTKKEGVIYIDDIYFSKNDEDKEKSNG